MEGGVSVRLKNWAYKQTNSELAGIGGKLKYKQNMK